MDDKTADMPLDKQTPAPNKHRGRKIVIVVSAFTLVAGAAALWAIGSDDSDSKNPRQPGMSAGPGSPSSSPEETIDGRYLKYDGTGFKPNVMVSLKCENGKPSVTTQWLARNMTATLLKDVVRVSTLTPNKADQCGWLVQVNEGAWYKEAVSYEDTAKGYWKIVEQNQNAERIHLINGGSNSITQVLISDSRPTEGEPPAQFYDLKAGNPEEGPDVLKLPKLPSARKTQSASPTATP